MVQNCLKPTTPSRSTGVRTHGWCHSVGNQMVEVMNPIRIKLTCLTTTLVVIVFMLGSSNNRSLSGDD